MLGMITGSLQVNWDDGFVPTDPQSVGYYIPTKDDGWKPLS